MFEKLQKKWKVSALQVLLILTTFAIGGSLTGFLGKKIMNYIPISDWLWVIIYIVVVTLIWPVAVLLVSIPFGQFNFFRKYIVKLGKRLGIGKTSSSKTPGTVNIAIFASGAGSNAEKIIQHFSKPGTAGKIELVVCNKDGAGVINIAKQNDIPVLQAEKGKFFKDGYFDVLAEKNIEFIILAGFLWKLPAILINNFPRRIVNIHPALLPKYGGKGMYGENVHLAVIGNKEKETGITIHYVDALYDNGDVIFQAKCPVLENDTPGTLAQRVHVLEHEHYPKVVEGLVRKLIG